jgi:hypothetical protein
MTRLPGRRREAGGVARGEAGLLDQRSAQLLLDGRVLLEVGEGLVAALADLGAVVGVPGAGLLDEAELLGSVDQLAELVDADAVEDLEVRLAERRRELVLDDLDLALAADRLVAALDRLLAPDVEADRTIELQSVATCGRLRIAIDDSDLLSQSIDEDHD